MIAKSWRHRQRTGSKVGSDDILQNDAALQNHAGLQTGATELQIECANPDFDATGFAKGELEDEEFDWVDDDFEGGGWFSCGGCCATAGDAPPTPTPSSEMAVEARR
eukprot:SAG31_NODE_3541_length_4143_cov_2.731949_2_plen_107_part_00